MDGFANFDRAKERRREKKQSSSLLKNLRTGCRVGRWRSDARWRVPALIARWWFE
jgi:hypothetical protein